MRTNFNRLAWAVLTALSVPLTASAGAVVAPPMPPVAGVAPAPATAKAGVAQGVPSQAASVVVPPEKVQSLAPATAQNGIQISGKPTADQATPLTPTAPVTKPLVSHKKLSKKVKAVGVIKSVKVSPYDSLKLVPVSNAMFNRFVFKEPVEGVFFPEGSPLPECPEKAGADDPCHPLFLNGKRVVLLQFRAGAKGPVQMLTSLHSGRLVEMYLAPAPGPGATVRDGNADDGPSDARLAEKANSLADKVTSLTASEQDVDMLSKFARGDIPAGFESEAVGPAARYEFFDVIPLAAWSDGVNWRVKLYNVKAFGDTPVAINNGLFRGENIRAVALDRDTITEKAPAQLYVLERLSSEQ